MKKISKHLFSYRFFFKRVTIYLPYSIRDSPTHNNLRETALSQHKNSKCCVCPEQTPRALSGRSCCRKAWIWTGRSARARPSRRSSSTGSSSSSRAVSTWSGASARSSRDSSICRKHRYDTEPCFKDMLVRFTSELRAF